MTDPAKIEKIALKPCPFCGCDIDVPGMPFTRDIKSARHPTNECILSAHTWWLVPRFIEPWNTRHVQSNQGGDER